MELVFHYHHRQVVMRDHLCLSPGRHAGPYCLTLDPATPRANKEYMELYMARQDTTHDGDGEGDDTIVQQWISLAQEVLREGCCLPRPHWLLHPGANHILDFAPPWEIISQIFSHSHVPTPPSSISYDWWPGCASTDPTALHPAGTPSKRPSLLGDSSQVRRTIFSFWTSRVCWFSYYGNDMFVSSLKTIMK